MIKFLKYILLILPVFLVAQTEHTEQDTIQAKYLIIAGDSIPRQSIDLDEVLLLHDLNFDSREAHKYYLILKRRTLKVYPYAKMAADKLDSLNTQLSLMKTKRKKRRYTRAMQKYIEGEFSDELKKLSRSQGQILVKLIHRQTGVTAFDLVKELRNGWRAFWYNTTASMFDISLKKPFDPVNEKDDYLIEDILQRAFLEGRLERQNSAVPFNFYDLTDKWGASPSK